METKVVELDLNDVLPNRFQPRIKFSEESIQELANSIKEHGVIQPIVVRNIGDKYEIIAGERRYKASILAGKPTIPAIITNLSEKDSAEVALIENVQRKDLTPIEEAISYKKILDMGYLTQDTLATKLGKTQSTIANKLRLLNLDDDVQEALLNEQISERHARSLLRLTSQMQQREMLEKIIEERLTVRKTDEEIDKMINNENNVEILNFGNQPEYLNPSIDNNQNVEHLEIFNPSIETLNIPTSPIVDDSIPEVLPTREPQVEVFSDNVFKPTPEIINSNFSPISDNTLSPVSNDIEQLDFGNLNPSNINIPTTPIEELKIEPLQVNDSLNPGFMDINKIENEATDIFPPKFFEEVQNYQTPSIEINENSNLEPLTNDENESAEDILVPGKFFNLMPEEDNEVKPNLEPVDNFNFNLDINNLNNVESTNNLPPLESMDSIPTLDNIMNLGFNQTNIEPQPVFDPIKNESLNNEKPVPLAMDNNQYVDSIAELEISNSSSATELQTLNEPEFNTLSQPVQFESQMNSGVNIKNAIDMIRNLSSELSKIGYVVDIEEFDFENMYQVIFKINK